MTLKYEPSLEPLHVSAKKLFLTKGMVTERWIESEGKCLGSSVCGLLTEIGLPKLSGIANRPLRKRVWTPLLPLPMLYT